MLIQASMILSNAECIIDLVLVNLVSTFDRVYLLLNNTTDNTEKIIKTFQKKYPGKIVLKKCSFIGYAETRNMCLRISDNPKYDYNFHLDDSFTVHGDIRLELSKIKKKSKGRIVHCIDISIMNEFKIEYASSRIIPYGSKAKYVGEIHETLDKQASCLLKNCFIIDHFSHQGYQRSCSRYLSDACTLFKYKDPRSLYLLADTLDKLNYLGSEHVNRNMVINAFLNRLKVDSENLEETMMAHMRLGFLKFNSVANFTKAAEIFPSRAGEAYFYLFMTTKLTGYLLKAYQYKNLGHSLREVDSNIYMLIPIYYHRYCELIPHLKKVLASREAKSCLLLGSTT